MEQPIDIVLRARGGIGMMLNAGNSEKHYLEWEVTFRKPLKSSIWSQMPLDSDRDYTYDLRIGVDLNGRAVPTYECLRTSLPMSAKYDSPFKYLIADNQRAQIFDRSLGKLAPFDVAIPQSDPKSIQLRLNSNAESDASRILEADSRLYLSRMTFANEYPIPTWVRSMFTSMAHYPGFNISASSPVRTKASEIRPDTVLEMQGNNLGTILHEVLTRSSNQRNAEQIRTFMSAAYPEFDEIFAETTFGSPPQVLIRIREKGLQRNLELWDLSDGMLRFLCLATSLFNPSPPPVVKIDEPESGLHPRLLPIVGDMIKTAAEDSQIIITTHSPDLLNSFELEDIAVISREHSKAVWSRPHSREALRALLENVAGENLGDLFKSGELEVPS